MTLSYTDQWLTIYGGDCREELRSLADGSVHCVVTSPPYFGLRDYGTASWDGGDPACDHRIPATGSTQNKGNNNREGKPFADRCGKCGAVRVDRQLGLEATPEEYVADMVAVFREVRSVLRDDGTLWLNLGDSYAASTKGSGGTKSKQPTNAGSFYAARFDLGSIKPKDLVGIPWRVAFALQADGWYLRSDIIWAKPNPMPESVTDRPTKSHEYLFLLTKAPRYFYDADAVREPLGEWSQQALTANWSRKQKQTPGGQSPQGFVPERGQGNGYGDSINPAGRNRRTVWNVATQPYPGAHFAVMPEALVEPCILAGTSERGVCPTCGSPWERVTQAAGKVQAHWKGTEQVHAKAAKGKHGATSVIETGQYTVRETTGWRATCDHDAEPVGAVVLDPFGGSGTVARVANRLSRRAILIDLNPDYLAQQLERNRDMPLGLTA